MMYSNKHKYMTNLNRKNIIFNSALNFSIKNGLFMFTIKDISKDVNCSVDLVKWYFRGIKHIRMRIINHAKEHGLKKILNTPIMDIRYAGKYISNLERSQLIFACAIKLNCVKNHNVNDIAKMAQCSSGLVRMHIGKISQIKMLVKNHLDSGEPFVTINDTIKSTSQWMNTQ